MKTVTKTIKVFIHKYISSSLPSGEEYIISMTPLEDQSYFKGRVVLVAQQEIDVKFNDMKCHCLACKRKRDEQ